MLWRNSSSKSKTRTTWNSFDSPAEREAQQSGPIAGQNHQAQQSQFRVRELRTLEKLKTAGKKGVLGIGKKPNRYEVETFQEAGVEISYKTAARVKANGTYFGFQS